MLPNDEKKARFLERQARIERKPKIYLSLGIGLILLAVFSYWFNNNYNRIINKEGGYYIGKKINYDGSKIGMDEIRAKIQDNKFIIPLTEVIDKKIVSAKYSDGKRKFYNGMDYLPLVFFIAPSGRVIAASAICEPCMGQKFFIEGDELVCVACGTRWGLEDLQGVSGGCTNYPPQEFKFMVQDKQIIIDELDLKNWKVRE